MPNCKQILCLSITIALICGSTSVRAQQLATIRDVTCACDSLDPYEVPVRIQSTRIETTSLFEPIKNLVSNLYYQYGGQCVDTARLRPGAIQEQDSTKMKFVIANFHHDRRFWLAHFDLNDAPVDTIELWVLREPNRWPVTGQPMTLGHSELLFKFRKPIALSLQSDLDTESSASDMIFSAEVTAPVGASYDPIASVVGAFPFIVRLVTSEQRGIEENLPYQKYQLHLTSDEKQHLLADAFEMAEELKTNRFYDITKLNCISQIVRLINGLPRFQNKPDYQSRVSWGAKDPVLGPGVQALINDGVITEKGD
jgi:hypothetical protein